MKILIPAYQLESILRHYQTLAAAYRYNGNTRAANAARLSAKEILKARALIDRQNKEWKETSGP